MATEHDPPVASEHRARDHGVADALDHERVGAPRQARLDQRGEIGVVMALRRHPDERGGEREQVGGVEVEHRRRRVGHVATPWSRRMSLSLALS